MAADHEIISVADSLMKAYGAKPGMYQIKINSRVLVNELLRGYLALSEEKAGQLIKLIDRMHKITPEKLDVGISEIGGSSEKIQELLKIKSLDELPDEVKSHQAADKLRELLELLELSNITNAAFDISLMRGFDYYTDIVFEVFDADPENNRSMFGGGRYDGLVALFGVDPVPTVGFGMGDVTLANFLTAHKLLPELPTETDLLIVVVGDVYPQAAKLATKLRDTGLNVSLDATARKLDKKLKSADKQGIRYTLFVGENELQNQQYPLRDLITGKEEKHDLDQIGTILKVARS